MHLPTARSKGGLSLASVYTLQFRQTLMSSSYSLPSALRRHGDIRLDILHPIQPEATDIIQPEREYGEDITLCSGLRTQDLLPRGTPEEMRAAVRRLKREMGVGGGYILAPGITVQADVPLRNLVAVIDEVRKSGADAPDAP